LTDPGGPAAVRAQDLEVRYARGPQAAVSGVSFRLTAGEGLVVSGPPGAGKTSLVRGLLGLAPTVGTAEVLGHAPGDPRALRRVGYGPERRPFPTGLRAGEVVALVAQLRGVAGPLGAACASLERAGLGDPSAEVARMDVEEARRLSLACALVGDPDVLVLDEPWEFPETLDALEAVRGRGGAILVATSDPGSLPGLLGRSLTLAEGAPAVGSVA
jgi:ABC-2 type transport system ATP-binding protein